MDCSDEIPAAFIRPANERPKTADLHSFGSTNNLPVIDLGLIHGPQRAKVLEDIAMACKTHGFFQVINHGIPENVSEEMLSVVHEFFDLPMECKNHLISEDPSESVRLSTSFNVANDTTKNWRQYLRLHCHPLDLYVQAWPSQPPFFRAVVAKYCSETRTLISELFELISQSIDLPRDYLKNKVGEFNQQMAMNCYPPCPQPELTLGLRAHFDSTIITLLLQYRVPGLQVLMDGKWVSVSPLKNCFVVNVGDQLQALTNGVYRSGFHRALVNSSELRVSIPMFVFPAPCALIEPAESLVTEENPRKYRSYMFEEFYHAFWTTSLDSGSCLNAFTM